MKETPSEWAEDYYFGNGGGMDLPPESKIWAQALKMYNRYQETGQQEYFECSRFLTKVALNEKEKPIIS